MGSPPPRDAPPPSEQDTVEADARFEPSPTGATLCGFGAPSFAFNLDFNFPGIPSFTIPRFDFLVQLNCDLSEPIDAEFAFGGGRVGQSDVDSDDELKQA
jgi:hypothetical protein